MLLQARRKGEERTGRHEKNSSSRVHACRRGEQKHEARLVSLRQRFTLGGRGKRLNALRGCGGTGRRAVLGLR